MLNVPGDGTVPGPIISILTLSVGMTNGIYRLTACAAPSAGASATWL
jgi:hypothetical protein